MNSNLECPHITATNTENFINNPTLVQPQNFGNTS